MFAACAWYEPRDKSWQILWRIKEFKHNKLNFISEHLQPSPTLVCTVYALIHILSTRTTEEYHFGKMYWKVLNWTRYLFWLVVSTPQKNISQLGWLFPIYGKIKKKFQTTNQIFIVSITNLSEGVILRSAQVLIPGIGESQELRSLGLFHLHHLLLLGLIN